MKHVTQLSVRFVINFPIMKLRKLKYLYNFQRSVLKELKKKGVYRAMNFMRMRVFIWRWMDAMKYILC